MRTPSHEPAKASAGHRQTILAALVVAALLCAAVLQMSLTVSNANHDVSWFLYAGERLLDGVDYGVDVVELNPPLIVGVAVVVSWLARLIGAPVMLTYNLLVLAGIGLLGLVLARILKTAFRNTPLPVALVFLLAPVQLLLSGYEYGQRDHLVFLLITPHLLMAAVASKGPSPFSRGSRVAAGLATGLAVCMKPHYVLVWIAIEMAVALRTRRIRFFWRTENATAVAFGALHLIVVVVFVPEYSETARSALQVYGAYNARVPLISERTVPTFAALALLLAIRPRDAAGRCATVSVVASIASFGALLSQQKDFAYHYIPCQLYAFLGVTLTLGAWLDGQPDERSPRVPVRPSTVLALALVVAILLSGLAIGQRLLRVDPQRNALAKVILEKGRREPVLFFSSSVTPAFPLVLLTETRSASPYSCFWQVAGNYSVSELASPEFPYRRLEQMSELERNFLIGIVDRIDEERPRLLFFDRGRAKHSFGTTRFFFERYFQADSRFKGLMKQYRSLGVVGGYFVAVRVPDAQNG
jgi:hypothetical protein